MSTQPAPSCEPVQAYIFIPAGSGSAEALSGDHVSVEEAEDPVVAMAGGGNGGSIIAGFVLFTVLVCAAYYVIKWKRSGDGRRTGRRL